MADDRPAVPAEQEALDRPWRLWASIFVGGFVAISLLLGMVLMPGSDDRYDLFTSICRAIGIPGYGDPATTGIAADQVQPASQVAFTATALTIARSGDVERGAALVAENCGACHGEDGIAVDPTFPNQAGQDEVVIYKQLVDYANGARASDLMAPVAAALTPEQMVDAAAYYASLEPVRRTEADTAVPQRIERLAIEGDPARKLPSCDSCHGPSRSGPLGSPALLGQPAPYLQAQLEAFATGTRANDIYGRMRDIAALLTEDEIRHLSVYYGGRPQR